MRKTEKSVVLVGVAVTAAALYAISKNNDDSDSDIGGALGGMWGGGTATTTTTTTETPSTPGTPLPSIVLPSIEPITIPTPADIFSDPIVANTSTPSNTPTTKKSVSAGVAYSSPLTASGGNYGYGGGGVGGRSGNAQPGEISINPLSAALGFIGGGLPGLFGSIVGNTVVSSVFGGVTPAKPKTSTTVNTLPGTITASIPATVTSPATKKSASIGGETYTDSAGNFTGARTYPDYSKAVIGNDGASYAHYTITDHTGHVSHQVERTSAVSGKKHVMSGKSAAILSGNSAAAKAWRKKYGDSGHSSSSSKKEQLQTTLR